MDGSVAITGSGSGLGLVVAEALVEAGARVVLIDRDRDALVAARDRFGDAVAGAVLADLADLDRVRGVAGDVAAAADLVGLVCNAGGWVPGDQFPAAPEERWLAAMTLNLLGPMLLTQRLLPRLARAGGAIVCIGSSGGLGREAYGSPEYGAAKAGLHRFVASLGGRSDVRVSAVVPGWIGLPRADRERAVMTPAERRAAGALVPPGRVAAEVVRLLEHGRSGEVVELLGR